MNQAPASRRHGYGPAALLAAGIGLPLAAACVLVVTAIDASPLQSDVSPGPVIAQVEPGEEDGRKNTTVRVEQGEQRAATSATDGLLTVVNLTAGEPVGAGTTAFVADGLPVAVFVAEAPLYRDLGPEDTGADVSSAQAFLTGLGYDVVVDGRFGSQTTQSVRAFNRDRGRPEDDAVLRRDSLLWVPPDATVPQTVSIRIGGRVSDGSDVYTTTTSSRLVLGTGPVDSERLLVVNGAEVPVDAGRDVVDEPADVQTVVAALAGESSGVGVIRLAAPRQVGVVPATAVVVDSQGVACLWSSTTSEPTILTEVTGVWGSVHVPADLVGTDVLLNPRQTRDLRCGS